ncbi:MAG TPA: 4-hydroxy-3-methylbut-2-enyl diphosphate reductase [Ignavibacteria bacterium]|nr:4-hydroxy-3-methylbut-2-enyl diphosphate reductase [Bacteroidota bacterium]HRI85218.1 4-hydroxy-3-methylbut-2-enyl diphosphate reductase [Ignavibacteria bacterium]HRK00836.1 4-hydroxy-3-methylbut-2-enyl diphosphate reductase [Ignavibacteria bacterium]
MKTFDIPLFYKSPVISRIKNSRKLNDPRKADYSPTKLDFGPVIFYIARHFGFCYGVENAIEISYKAIEENPDKRIYLLSEMIHNPDVNNDLMERGVKFLMDTSGRQLIDWNILTSDDIVIVPAFGTTLEIEKQINQKGIDPLKYNTTCPFVEKVWNRAETLGKNGFTVIVHGKYKHEETRATFSHSKESSPTLIIRDIAEAVTLGDIILGKKNTSDFYKIFSDRYSAGFDPSRDLNSIGVVNQTTMLATETQSIADYLYNVMTEKFGPENIREHFSDTRDTLCYATHDNQKATYGLLEKKADLALVVGGYNSSNTSHIYELCEEKLPTYFISSADKILSKNSISHFDFYNHKELTTSDYIPQKHPVKIILTSGASCPDSIVDEVLQKILSYFEDAKTIEEVMNEYFNAKNKLN